MATVTLPPPLADGTLADLLKELGNVPLNRIRLTPLPGTATEQDVLDVARRTGRPAELIDGVLVEKTVGYIESLLAVEIASRLKDFVRPRRLGLVLGEAGALRILAAQVRVPDVCFIRRERLPEKLPAVAIPAVAPDLAIEVLSESNTEAEMQRKLRDYFASGTQLVWYIDPRSRTAHVYTAPEECTVLTTADALTGGALLPGFELSLNALFGEMDG